MPITAALRHIVEDRATLGLAEATELMQQILAGESADVELAALLGAMAGRGETAEELAGFVLAMRAAAKTLPLSPEEQSALVDTCGTGGDASHSFNISTAAALVAAAAGAKVAKHGNRAITSRCGSADVLEALGIAIDLTPEAATEQLRAHNFCFLLAPSHHPAMKAVMPVRRALGVRTLLHVMGPLLNPAGARRQVMGVYHPRLVPLVAEAMTHLGIEHALVVHGDSQLVKDPASPLDGRLQGQDEIALSGPTLAAEVRNGAVVTSTLTPEQLGLTRAPLSALEGGDAATNAAILRSIFAGEPGPRREIVLLNAAAVLVTAGRAESLTAGLAQAAEAIDSGAVTALVAALSQR
jgi:anthranilate phosphoribosyltransferase